MGDGDPFVARGTCNRVTSECRGINDYGHVCIECL